MAIFLIFIVIFLIILFYMKTNPDITKNQKVILIILRSIAISIIIILLFNPILKIKHKKLINKKTVVLNDVSESMNQKFAGKTKKSYFSDLLNMFKSRNLTVINFSNGINGTNSTTDIEKTLQDLKKIYSIDEIKNIILLSDGWFKNDNLNFIKNLPFPIYTIIPNVKTEKPNLQITDLRYNKNGYTKDQNPISVVANATHYNGKARVNLYIANKLVSSQNVDFSKNNSKKLLFYKIFQKEGLYKFHIKIEPTLTINESTLDDNEIKGAINILKNKTNILIVTDFLNWDVKFINYSLRQNSHWNIKTINYVRNFFIGRKPILLKDEFKNVSNLIIINNGRLHFNNLQINLITNFVKNGGGLLYVGMPIKNLAILPIKNDYFKSNQPTSIMLTELSKNYTSFDWQNPNIPPLDYLYVNPKKGSKILSVFSNPENSPAIIYSKYQKGKILYFAFYQFWRWQMWDKNNQYSKFIQNITKWLHTKDIKRFRAVTAKTGYLPGEKVNIIFTAFDEKLVPMKSLNPKIIIENIDTKQKTTDYLVEDDNKYKKERIFSKPGKYKYCIYIKNKAVATGSFLVFNIIPESLDRGFNLINLKYISSITSGKSFKLNKKNIEKLLSLTKNKEKPIIIIQTKKIPLYKKIYLVLLFIISFVIELYLRKKWGLI